MVLTLCAALNVVGLTVLRTAHTNDFILGLSAAALLGLSIVSLVVLVKQRTS